MLILGAGINGAVSAAVLAARGLKVALIDRADFASACSSNSSNLVWGGIKYLESGEWLLVNKLCRSRNRLMRHYPTRVREVRFLASIKKDFRMPIWFVYLGAVAYWFIGACFTKAPRYLTKQTINEMEPMVNMDAVSGGVEYSDCYLPDNDARFVFYFIRSALNHDCAVANYVEATGSEFNDNRWLTKARDVESGDEFNIRSKILINCCGPYVDIYNRSINQTTSHQHAFSKGIHLIVKRLTEDERVLAFFASDGRLFFVIPMGPKTCIGTTDTRVESPQTVVTDEDRQFVLDNVNHLLALSKPLTTADIIAERCGVRPLVVERQNENPRSSKRSQQDWMKLSRKHAIDCNREQNFICIFGGKLTDCLNVGEEIESLVKQLLTNDRDLKEIFNREAQPWYGEPGVEFREPFMHRAREHQLDNYTPESSHERLSQRFWRRYGKRAQQLLDWFDKDPDGVTRKPIDEIEYCCGELRLIAETEMVTKLDDFLRRRSKVSQVIRMKDFVNHPGLLEIARILFAEQAEQKLMEYRQSLFAQS